MRWVAALLLAGSSLALRAAPVEYLVRWKPQERQLDVAVCVEAAAARRVFSAAHERSSEFLLDARRRDGGALQRRAHELVAEPWPAGGCVDYKVDTRELGGAGDVGARGRSKELLTSPRAWLWRPVDLAMEPDAEIRFELPPGWNVSVPWEPAGGVDEPRFRLGATTPRWPALVAIGQFKAQHLDVGGKGLRLAVLGALPPAQVEILTRFVATVGRDVAAVFPLAFAQVPQVALIPVGARGDDPVPFGQSLRGGGTGLVLYVDPTRSLEDYVGNWTLAHELGHLVHPYLGDEGRWISEGMGTYYQSVVRARGGRITAAEAWTKFEEGFDRGRANPSGLSLRETSERMDRGLYMRGYWSGTALVLMADLALRTRADSPTSLDAVLNRYLECCRDTEPRRRPREFLAALDEIAGEPVFARLYDTHADQVDFPDLAAAYRTLGIATEGDELRFSDDPGAVRLRTAIMGSD